MTLPSPRPLLRKPLPGPVAAERSERSELGSGPLRAWAMVLVSLMLAACTSSELLQVDCFDDDDCATGQRCVNGSCVAPDSARGDVRPLPDDPTEPDDAGLDTGFGAEVDAGAGGDDTNLPDASIPPDPTLLPAGEPCFVAAECRSGLCARTSTGGPLLCVDRCSGTCPLPGYRCSPLPDGGTGCVSAIPSTCPATGDCAPGAVQRERGRCGDCDEGEQLRTRVCSAECAWGAWGAWGLCATEATCAPGDVESSVEACDSECGVRERSRACDPAVCDWADWDAWGACSTESTASCTPGTTETETEACGGCAGGERSRTRTCAPSGCGFGPWTDWSTCDERPVVCSAGELDTRTESCGTCDLGSRTQSRTCTADGCGWTAWSDWSSCSEVAPTCSPGQADTQSRACGNCGSQTRRRTCNDACSWGGWSDWTTCGGQGPCASGATRPCSTNDCGVQTCTTSCQWDETCRPNTAIGNECLWQSDGGSTGSRWRCCGSGGWQFCLASCRWSRDCAPCTGCGC